MNNTITLVQVPLQAYQKQTELISKLIETVERLERKIKLPSMPIPIRDVEDITGISKSTLRKAKRDGALTAYKFHDTNKVYFLLDEVIDLFSIDE